MPNVTTFDALLSGMTWNGVEVVGRPVFLTYSFDSAPAASLSQSFSTAFLSTFQAFNPNGQAVARTALQAWADACGVTFFEVPAGQGDIRFGVYDLAKGPPDVEDSVGFAFNPLVYAYPDGAAELDLGGDIFIQVGQVNFAALVHEIGHALGLKHPFEGLLTLEPSADNLKNTVMSYSPLGGPAIGLGVLDVQAATYLYGAATADGGQAASWSWDAHRSVLTQAGGPGADSLAGVATADRILGGAGADYIFTRAGDDSVDGGDGGDTVAGGDGSDTLSGAGGADLLDGGEGDDVVRGGEDDDRLWGLRGADTLMGETGDDTLQGGAGLNRLLGGSGNDVMVITSGASVVDGGDGDDALWLMPSTSASVTLSYASLTAGGGSYANVERIVFVGSSAPDTLQGGELPDQMAAGDGADSLSGGVRLTTSCSGNPATTPWLGARAPIALMAAAATT